MALKWSDEYATGVREVDEQHQEIFGVLNELERLLRQGETRGPRVEQLLSQIVADTVTHFKFEEQCMNRFKCPAAEANQAAHAAFLATVAAFQERVEQEGTSDQLLRGLHSTAESWLQSHICQIDVHLKTCAPG